MGGGTDRPFAPLARGRRRDEVDSGAGSDRLVAAQGDPLDDAVLRRRSRRPRRAGWRGCPRSRCRRPSSGSGPCTRARPSARTGRPAGRRSRRGRARRCAGEPRVHEQRPSRRSRGGSARRGARRARAWSNASPSQRPSPTWSRMPWNWAVPSCTAVSVDEELLERRAERRERGHLVGEERVAAGGRDATARRIEPSGGPRHEGDVGVPVDAPLAGRRRRRSWRTARAPRV